MATLENKSDSNSVVNEALGPRFQAYCETYSMENKLVDVDGVDIIVHPGVFSVAGASTTPTLLQSVGDTTGLHVLDMGCGTGVLGITAGLRGASSVLMVDTNGNALRNAQANVELHQLSECCEVRKSDLFSSIGVRKFDLILFNVPFLYAPEGTSVDLPTPGHLKQAIPGVEAFVDVGYQLIRRFMSQVDRHLTPSGVVRCSFASFGNQELFDQILKESGLKRRTVASRKEKQYGLEYLAFEVSPSKDCHG